MEIRLVTFPLYVVLLVVKTRLLIEKIVKRKGTPTHGRTKVQEITSTDIGAYWGNALFFGVILVDEKVHWFSHEYNGSESTVIFYFTVPFQWGHHVKIYFRGILMLLCHTTRYQTWSFAHHLSILKFTFQRTWEQRNIQQKKDEN